MKEMKTAALSFLPLVKSFESLREGTTIIHYRMIVLEWGGLAVVAHTATASDRSSQVGGKQGGTPS